MTTDRTPEQPCTDTRCDAPTHPLDTEGAILPPITEPIALDGPATDAQDGPGATNAPDTHTDTPETREGAREAHSDDERLAKYAEAVRIGLDREQYVLPRRADASAARAVMAVADAEVERQEDWYADLHRRTLILDGLLAVERARVARVEALADELWAQSRAIDDPNDSVRVIYGHIVSQFRGALEERA